MYGLAVFSVALFAGQGTVSLSSYAPMGVVTYTRTIAAATAISARSPILSLLRRQSAADFDPSEIPPQVCRLLELGTIDSYIFLSRTQTVPITSLDKCGVETVFSCALTLLCLHTTPLILHPPLPLLFPYL